MILLLLTLTAGAAEPADPIPVRDALVAELERTSELNLPKQGPPHHVLLRAGTGWSVYAGASFGALVSSSAQPRDDLDYELRVGDATFDSSGLQTFMGTPGFSSMGLPDVPLPRAVRVNAWLSLDSLYKDAVENLGRKQAVRRDLERGDDPIDAWQVMQGPVQQKLGDNNVRAPGKADLEALVRHASAHFRGRDLLQATVRARVELGHRILVATDGTRVIEPVSNTAVWATLRARADDGEERSITRTLRFVGVTLPPVDELTAVFGAMATSLEEWRTAPRIEGPWYGPVLIEGPAAARYASRLLIKKVRGTPSPARFRSWDQSAKPAADTASEPGTRLLPRGWTAVDDATRAPGDPCCPVLDAEGVKPQSVLLIDDGVVVGHLMTRTPSKHFSTSTGHARAKRDQRATASATWVTVTAPRELARAKLRKEAFKAAREAGVDRVLVLRSAWGGGGGFWLHADGTETPVRGVSSKELDARAMRGMTVAGPSATYDRPTGLVRITTPDLLFRNVAVGPDTDDELTPPTRRKSPMLSAAPADEAAP